MEANLNDVKFKALGDLGYVGTLNEREYKFYKDLVGGQIPINPQTPPYTATGMETLREFDAMNASEADIINVLGTLITDLKSKGII